MALIEGMKCWEANRRICLVKTGASKRKKVLEVGRRCNGKIEQRKPLQEEVDIGVPGLLVTPGFSSGHDFRVARFSSAFSPTPASTLSMKSA